MVPPKMVPRWLVSVGNTNSRTPASKCLPNSRWVSAGSDGQQLRPSVRLSGWTCGINRVRPLEERLPGPAGCGAHDPGRAWRQAEGARPYPGVGARRAGEAAETPRARRGAGAGPRRHYRILRGVVARGAGRLVGRGEEEALRDAPVGGRARVGWPGGQGRS